MSKLLQIVALLVASSSMVSGELFHEHEEIPYFFQIADKQNASLCCAHCIEDNTCTLTTENRRSVCHGYIDHESIGLIEFPGGRMIATSQRLDDKWQLLWIENGDDPVLMSRDFNFNECAWKSDVRFDDDLDRDVFETLTETIFDPSHDHELLASLDQASCGQINCDVTVYKKRTKSVAGHVKPATEQNQSEPEGNEQGPMRADL